MAQPHKRKAELKSAVAPVGGRQASLPLIEQHLVRILSGLADLLLRHGYGYQRVSKLAKVAFVKAAQQIGNREHSRTSIARIATLTGLTRIEVSRLLKSNGSPRAVVESDFNRATRVAEGWVSDPLFSDELRRPLPLAFSGARSFTRLVRKFSGDIPARAMLLEMQRLRMVREDINGAVCLVRQRPVLARSTIDAIRAIAPWVDLLSDADKSSQAANLTSTTHQVRIQFESHSQVLASIRELENRRRTFVSSIEQLATTKRPNHAHEMTVTVAVAATQSHESRLRKSVGDKKRHEGKN